uniref:Putative U6 snRNA-associated Sm-like protein LSm5p n=1 Tax=Trypanosoma congolense (strain IL3000) TaxID=1068625 RepID=G0UP11_TRYCI|nr:putative U6 snRNA-associated Sm-like protein LSm5p [Trypanosoma congolense IL3000]
MSVSSERRSLLHFLGCRINVALDDGSSLTGRLVSFSSTSNLILTDAERVRKAKRRRGRTITECYNSVLFVRGSSVISVSHTSGVTTDATVIDSVAGRQAAVSKTVQAANMSLDAPLR